MLFDVENGNPNGDPDAGNAPRIDSESVWLCYGCLPEEKNQKLCRTGKRRRSGI